MKAMILAAGLGKRMRPLTEHVPKPLIKAGDQYLIAYHLKQIQAAGIKELVINTHWLGESIKSALGHGESYGVSIHYSEEKQLLETAGGIAKALPMLTENDDPFLLINGDIYCELDLKKWICSNPMPKDALAWLALVENPEHNPSGDFQLTPDNLLIEKSQLTSGGRNLTYAGIAQFRPSFFAGIPIAPTPLAPLLKQQIAKGKVQGNLISDYWLDVGTVDRLQQLEEHLKESC